MDIVSAALLGYLLGSIPFGLLLAKFGGAGDIREIGSGNIGATNVLRTGRKSLAAATLLLDLLKGTAAVLLARQLLPGCEVIAAVAAFFGHLYPVWLGFKGGKGVATYAGILFGLHWPLGLVYGVAWIGVLLASRISSLGGLVAAAVAPLAAAFLGLVDVVIPLVACSLIVFWKHRENIQRLMAGTEPRIGQK
ncbi:MAG: glycerol-3-phosphate 1-O-acyltransferase PlsY [Sphingomonadales bacterium]|nr:glycerol-3-phosphate 1-O-acyltransferase PlsY [Sphingomonadales bacterium]MBK9003303.1 glycerol-3-phosphate 1-O-acyltransferase PlsY [Sphingomonadales bacterium]MBK9268710.1 glycerol-3-phosphate 1-O-acyltransferase PlsY [Sphingomonadales bacterium]